MVLKPTDWNTYRILCQGKRIQLWINDFQTVDYTEPDHTIKQSGKIALKFTADHREKRGIATCRSNHWINSEHTMTNTP